MTQLIRTSGDNPTFRGLTLQLDQELWERYPTTQQQYAVHNMLSKEVKAVIAMEAGQAVGCGAFRELESGKVEVKRMFVQPAYRGKGISKLILQELEKWAREENHSIVILETGNKQPEAIGLYTSLGYERIPNYSAYQGLSESICMQKEIA